ncbi:acyl-CoA transferase [Bordetella trematum]|uniref:CaiB/BaiF CoA transferase family protein n=1 Tax=Bordetella trematum TaxID=123899 RepID=UPI0004709E51|nr:CoA transferase [Bordetella trematum]AUL47005.1 CoA transferase [Bordetella trematum]QIM72386.1 CoA transferase [Bordetella trematum]SAI00599.1 acyl-CoA transferase [Bordetella trematum]SPU49658.1 acyl-CoA transferase [Bordetella trematum]VDH07410.1 Formyl-coenzyme A transferase [Bordetella trematum]
MNALSPMALAGVKVLDLSRILAGPSAAQLLGDLGADVVKVEKPGEGDDTRKWGPPYIRDQEGQRTDESAYYLSANRNKRSIAIDIASEQGQALVHRLIAQADVLIENYKKGGLAKYGLSYEQIRERYPRLVYCSVTGFGQTGPYASRPGYDFLIQGMGGIMSLTGEPQGQPMKVGVGIADVMTGMYAAVGILAALRHRDATGQGQQIDISLLDTQIAWLVNAGTNYLAERKVPTRLGNGHPNIVPYQVFSTADSPMILAVGNDGQFQRFCEVAGLTELAADPRYATNVKRIENRVALCALIDERLQTRARRDWLAALEAAGVPCGPVNDLQDVFEDPHVQARGAELRMPCAWAEGGEVGLLANPLKMSVTPPTYRHAPPRINEHEQDVLADWLGQS